MKTPKNWPVKLRHERQGKVLATIYKKQDSPGFTVSWRVGEKGQRKGAQQDFKTYPEALKKAKKVVAERVKDDSPLSPVELKDARRALETLRGFYVGTGHRLTLHDAAEQVVTAKRKLGDRLLSDAVDGFLSTVATVKRIDLSAAVEDFIKADAVFTEAPKGQRPQLSPGFAKQKAKMLRNFAAMFPGHAVRDLTTDFIDTFMAHIRERKDRPAVSPKSRNHHRTVLKQFPS